jgi:hypothetical protein
LHNLALFWVKNANFLPCFLAKIFLKIITSVPGHPAWKQLYVLLDRRPPKTVSQFWNAVLKNIAQSPPNWGYKAGSRWCQSSQVFCNCLGWWFSKNLKLHSEHEQWNFPGASSIFERPVKMY